MTVYILTILERPKITVSWWIAAASYVSSLYINKEMIGLVLQVLPDRLCSGLLNLTIGEQMRNINWLLPPLYSLLRTF